MLFQSTGSIEIAIKMIQAIEYKAEDSAMISRVARYRFLPPTAIMRYMMSSVRRTVSPREHA